jgi:ribonuclease P protein component
LKIQSFPKSRRIVSNVQFKDILANGRRVRDELLNLYIAQNNCGCPRLGISVGKACGDAVARNRLKRLIREAFRRNQDKIPAGCDYVVTIARSNKTKSKKHKTDDQEQKNKVQKVTFEQISSIFRKMQDNELMGK